MKLKVGDQVKVINGLSRNGQIGRVEKVHESGLFDLSFPGMIGLSTNWMVSEVELVSPNEPSSELYVSPTGAKRLSVGKVPMSFVPLDLLDGTVEVLADGATTYGRNNYRNGFPPLEVLDSLMRHLAQLQRALETEDKTGERGHLLDEKSKKAHVHHVVCNALFLIDSMRKDGYRV
jgi:hypothetical protein